MPPSRRWARARRESGRAPRSQGRDEWLIPSVQRQWRLERHGKTGPFALRQVVTRLRPLHRHEVRVRIRIATLNHRDLYVKNGEYPPQPRERCVPLSDGAGDVVSVGSAVTRFGPGDRVVASFFQRWIRGHATPDALGSALGGELDGVLSEYVTLHEQGLAHIPPGVSFETAATLPCAGVTAFNGLFTRGHLERGEWVLLEGTGGVSMLGLQLATAVGANAIVTSSSDSKLRRARRLGARATVNYRRNPNWEDRVLELTGGVGVQHVLEVGGASTRSHALACLGSAGHIALIGGLGGFGGEISVDDLAIRRASASGIYVGSRFDLERLLAMVRRYRIRGPVGLVVPFEEAARGYGALKAGDVVGKVAIRVG